MKLKIGAGLVCAGVLSACSGGGGDATFNVPQFDTVSDVLDANADAAVRVGALGASAPADVPTSGSATYAGPVLINDISGSTRGASVSGGMEVIVDFENAGNIRGEAGNFFDPDGTAVEGTLTISDSDFTVIGAEVGFRSSLTGRLTNVGANGSETDFDYDLELSETFAGGGAEALLGAGAGTATEVGTSNAQAVTVSNVLEER